MKSRTAIIILALSMFTSLSLMSCVSLQERLGFYRNLDPQFTLQRLVIAKDVQKKEPVGISDTFPATTKRVYCFIDAKEIKRDTQIKFVWYWKNKKVHTYKLPLKQGHRWRTFAYKNLSGHKGKWKVKVKDTKGYLVKSISFKVE